MSGAFDQLPQDLGRVEDVDVFDVAPGAILLDRFCALEEVVRRDERWTVAVTDLERQLGAPPTHRLVMEFVRSRHGGERKVQRSVSMQDRVQAPVHAWMQVRDGLLLLVEPTTTPRIQTPLTRDESITVGLALSSLLTRLHDLGVTGIDVAPDQIHLLGQEVEVEGHQHLLDSGTAEEDVQRVADLVQLLSGGDLTEELRSCPSTANELWDRFRGLRRGSATPRESFRLPSVPPFIGRMDVMARLMEAARGAKRGHSQVLLVQGPRGVGKTRLLQRFTIEIDRWMDAVILGGAFHTSAPTLKGGFVQALNAITERPGALSSADLSGIRGRILAATGPMAGIVADLSPRMRTFLGDPATPPDLILDEGFNRHAATLATAIRAIGTRERPLVVLLDDAQVADPSSHRIVRELVRGSGDHHTLVVLFSQEGAEIAKDVSARVLDLPALTHLEVRELLDRSVPGDLADPAGVTDRLWNAGRGIPVAVWATLQSWAVQGQFVQSPRSGWELRAEASSSTRVVDLYGRLWEGLRPHQQWLLLLAALRSGRVTEEWLAQVTGWSATEVHGAIEVAVDAGLLVREANGALRFPNNSAREVAEERMAAEVRTKAHRQVAEWLAREPGVSATQRAWHLERGRPSGRSEPLAELHVEAGHELLAIYDLGRARWHFEGALTRTTMLRTRIDAVEGLADVALLEGRVDEALRDYLEAMSGAGDALRGLEIAAKAIHGFYRKSAADAALRLASEALALAREPLPTTLPGRILAFVTAVAGALWISSRQTTKVRDLLCRVYTTLVPIVAAERPLVTVLSILRGYRHSRGLDSANGAAMTAIYAAFRASLGHTRVAARVLNDAETVGRRADNTWGLGVVEHIRGQNQMAIGQYAAGRASFERAVDYFQQTGDLSVGVLSLVFRAMYGRESLPVDEVVRYALETETVARRQGNVLGLHVGAAVRLCVLARRGDPVLEEALAVHAEATSLTHSTVSTDQVVVHANLALAFVQLRRIDLARTHALTALRALESGPPPVDYLLDAHVAVVETYLRLPDLDATEQRDLARSLRVLRTRGRRSPRLAAAWRLFEAERLARLGRAGDAQRLLRELVASLPQHEQHYFVYRAHVLLADLGQADEVLAASKHREQAERVAVELGLRDTEAEALPGRDTLALRPLAVADAPATREPPAVSVQALVNRLRPAFERALPQSVPLRVEIEPSARVRCNAESLQLLVVNMVLAARDALSDGHGSISLSARSVTLEPEPAASLSAPSGEAHLLIEIRAVGFSGGDTISGLGMCCEITAGIGGFMDVRQEGHDMLVLGAYLAAGTPGAEHAPALPAASVASDAIVFHSDARVRQTVVSALRDMGIRSEGVDPRLNLHPGIDANGLLFTEPEHVADLPAERRARVVLLVGRGSSPLVEGYPVVRVPFTVGELEAVIESLSPAGGSSERGSPQR